MWPGSRQCAGGAVPVCGPGVALAAPGGYDWKEDALTELTSQSNSGFTHPVADSTGLKQCTTFSAPQSTGVASLMLVLNPALSPEQLIARIQAVTRPYEHRCAAVQCLEDRGLSLHQRHLQHRPARYRSRGAAGQRRRWVDLGCRLQGLGTGAGRLRLGAETTHNPVIVAFAVAAWVSLLVLH